MKLGINSRIYTSEYTGIQNYIKGLYKSCLKIDKKHKYIFFQFDSSKTLGKNTKTMGLPNNQLGAALFDNFLVNFLVKKERVDIYHGASNVLPLFKIPGVKYVVTIHDVYFMVNPEQALSTIGQYYYKLILKHTVKNADFIIVYSENTKNDIIKFFNVSSEKIKVIYAGIDEYYFKSEKSKRLIDGDYIFAVMTHPTRKNTQAVLEAFSMVKELSNAKLVVAGPDHIINLLSQRAAKLDLTENLILFGPASKKQMASLYTFAVAFVFPSLYEGFGFPVLEAMACGCPVITANNSSLSEVTLNKKWLVDAEDVNGLARKMRKLVKLSSKERAELVKKNSNFAKNFTWDKTAKLTIKEFERLVKNDEFSNGKIVNSQTKSWNDYYEGLIKIKPSNIVLHFQYLIKILSFHPKKILEIGCGPADHSVLIKKLFPKIKISLLDLDKKILKKVEEKYGGLITNIYLYDIFNKKQIAQLPKFDVVMSQGLLEHFEDKEFAEIINNFSRKAKKGVFSIPSNHYENRDFGNEILRPKREVEMLLEKYCKYRFYVRNYIDIGIRTKINLIKQNNLGAIEAIKTLFFKPSHLLIVIDYTRNKKND